MIKLKKNQLYKIMFKQINSQMRNSYYQQKCLFDLLFPIITFIGLGVNKF